MSVFLRRRFFEQDFLQLPNNCPKSARHPLSSIKLPQFIGQTAGFSGHNKLHSKIIDFRKFSCCYKRIVANNLLASATENVILTFFN